MPKDKTRKKINFIKNNWGKKNLSEPRFNSTNLLRGYEIEINSQKGKWNKKWSSKPNNPKLNNKFF